MHRFLEVLMLFLLAGCVSPTESATQKQIYWNTQKTALNIEQKRLHGIYRSWFERGFLEAWAGHRVTIETEGLTGKSTDPDGDSALHEGHTDGQRAGNKARLAYEMKQAESENP
jgi:hypothetical protein